VAKISVCRLSFIFLVLSILLSFSTKSAYANPTATVSPTTGHAITTTFTLSATQLPPSSTLTVQFMRPDGILLNSGEFSTGDNQTTYDYNFTQPEANIGQVVARIYNHYQPIVDSNIFTVDDCVFTDQITCPSPPVPFLDLPFDYQSKGKSFDYVVFHPFSWFDHKYPLQNECPPCLPPVMIYTGEIKDVNYHTHNGYDYGVDVGVKMYTPVLAAASGVATFRSESESGGAGNVIKIDHGNGYQTWYEHLDPVGLIQLIDGKAIVNKGDVIGRVGMTGNTNGPHIHFSVFYNRNYNNTFDDDIPLGVVDPLGWEGKDEDGKDVVDPWVEYGGSKSYKLFLGLKNPQEQVIQATGGVLETDNNKVQIVVPNNAANSAFTLTYKDGPFEAVSDLLQGVAPSFFLNAVDNFGQAVTQFLQPIQIQYNYTSADLFNVKEETLKLYYLNEILNQWEPLSTSQIDMVNKIVTAQTNHLSHFALMGKVIDKVVPTTEIIVYGDKGQDNWYRSIVSVELNGKDNEGGLGLEYTLYTFDNENWQIYSGPLVFEQEGNHTIIYQSFDKAGNEGERKTVKFYIDKTPPVVSIHADPSLIWPPNGKTVDVYITGSSLDKNIAKTSFHVIDEYHLVEPILTDFNQIIQLEARRSEDDSDGRTYTIQAKAEDKAGNTSKAVITVVVPHDQRN